jgi:hypothetical protein
MIEQTAGTPAWRLGFWAAVLTAVGTAGTFAVAVTTLPVSGPFCAAGCVAYPYREVASLVPHDYVWMYGATVLLGIYVVLLACIHTVAAESRRLYSLLALVFGAMAAAVLAGDYYVQIAALQPSILRGEFEGLALVTQYRFEVAVITINWTLLIVVGVLLSIWFRRQR